MTDYADFMTLPSLVRQAIERSAGQQGLDAHGKSVVVTNEDWFTIRNYLVELQTSRDELRWRLDGLEK